MKLHVKLTLLVISLILVTGCLSVFFVSQTMREAMDERLGKEAMLIGVTMAEHITHSVIDREVVAVREAIELFYGRMEDVVYVCVVDFDGRIFAHTFERGLPRLLLEREAGEKIAMGGIERYSIVGEKILDVCYPLIPGMRAHLHIGMRKHDPFASVMRVRILGVAAAIMLFGSMIAVFMSRRITRPLSRLSESLRSFGKGEMEKEIEFIGGGREVGELTDSFNRMLVDKKRAEDELKEYATALEEARNDLEQKVEKRTRELKEAHEALVRKEKLAVLGQLSSGVGHELRNPLGVIKNGCYFLNMKMKTIEDEAVKDNIKIMNREINTANKIITDLLDFARIKEPVRLSTDINQLITETLSKSLIPENIIVSQDFAEDIGPVSVDPVHVGQIFLNLIENGVHAMEQGGSLTISTRVTKGATEVVFIDNGCGIPEDNLEKIFEPLFTTKVKGIGLGLAVSKSLAQVNGATILVESEEGKGSRFVVRFRDSEL
ncbi:MAG: HAMP domain-containing protein [Desulfobulbaceae bacterium]|nr:HAMP domain-containing protein [Desulfobulbaceae bacterium]